MALRYDFNRVKPGHINMGRALRSLGKKTNQSRSVLLSIPAIFQKDAYGVQTNTIEMPAIDIPDIPALISPISTKDFTLAKEGRYIQGAARVYVPSMDQLFARVFRSGNSPSSPKFLWESETRPITTTTQDMLEYFRSIDGLMDAVLYDTEATIFDSTPFINITGTENWSATTDYAGFFGEDWKPYASGAKLSTDYESVTLTVSGTTGRYGTFWWQMAGGPALQLADRVSFEYNLSGMQGYINFYVLNTNAGGDKYPWIKYGSTGDGNSTNGIKSDTEQWLKVDLPLTSGSLTASGTASYYATSMPVNSYVTNDEDNLDPENQAICINQNQSQGTLNTVDYPWSTGGPEVFLGWRTKQTSSTGSCSIRNIKFYRTLPWSIHSIKEYNTDYMVLNCIRTDGDSMHRQEAYVEQAPEL